MPEAGLDLFSPPKPSEVSTALMGTEGVDATSREALALHWILRPWTSEEDQMASPELRSA